MIHDATERINSALGALASGPRNLRAYLGQPGPDFAKADDQDIEPLLDLLLASNPNASERLRFSDLMRTWDNTKSAKWTDDTARNTAERRELIYKLLHASEELERRISMLIPFYSLSEPLVIAEQHEEWYAPQLGERDYYWRRYIRYLREQRGWRDEAVLDLDNSTRAIVECIANPESERAYASRGLVVGYVQSGKTANFTGVIARAADAGYRLVIVLAGTWNILRNQTQRRLDKELLGKELLLNDDAYSERHPPDWSEFLEHGVDPSILGHFSWQRLTRPDIDFRRLKAAIDNLEFERLHKDVPLFDPQNLHRLPAKLLVIKKHAGIVKGLVRDLKLIRTKLVELPTLIIDDESDQAGLNTLDPAKRNPDGSKQRPPTNGQLVELLSLFPRGQYIGYTATPYANAFVDPDDEQDLFPKDFLIPMERPTGYMGIRDFFDPDVAFEDLRADDFAQPEIAFVRRVPRAIGEDDEDLKAALRSYVLGGALKLYRLAADPARYRETQFQHHTMLLHTSSRTGEHGSLAERVKDLWNECAFNTAKGLVELAVLWSSDFAKVCEAQGSEARPSSFVELQEFLANAIKRIETGPSICLVVNSDKGDAPDFSAARVWKVIIGGNKLSRGYTIEGLTVSYYRRVTNTAETLMQMGRWFGFRPGYQDVVRVFIGVKEGRKADVDLVASFKEVCRLEERFRGQLAQYRRRPGMPRITPKQIPPLVSAAGSLPPTSKNKMFNAVVNNKNFGGELSMPTLAPAKPPSMDANRAAAERLLVTAKALGGITMAGHTTKPSALKVDAILFETSNDALVKFLDEYHWLESDFPYPARPADAVLQMDFLKTQRHGITSWLVVAPQRKTSFGEPLRIGGGEELSVKERHRSGGRGFQVFGEPEHRLFARYLADVPADAERVIDSNAATEKLRKRSRGICLLYPVREEEKGAMTIGFELLFPKNELPFDLNFSVVVGSAKTVTVPRTESKQ